MDLSVYFMTYMQESILYDLTGGHQLMALWGSHYRFIHLLNGPYLLCCVRKVCYTTFLFACR